MRHLWLAALLLVSSNVLAWPQWVIQPSTNPDQLVGVGVGKNRAQAREAALAEIVTQLSINVVTKQQQTLSKQGNDSQDKFNQTTQLESLPFDLSGVQELNSAEQNGDIAILLGVNKTLIVDTLSQQVALLLDRVPDFQSDALGNFIAAVQFSGIEERCRHYLMALKGLGFSRPALESRYQQAVTNNAKALTAVSVEVIGAGQLGVIKSAISSAFSGNGLVKVWIKPDLTWRSGKSAGMYIAKAQLNISYQMPVSPFSVLLRQTLVADGRAFSAAQARQQALELIVKQLHLSPSEWNTGSDTL